ncbi:MAG TPA: ABC transporter permease [Vicinamibacterales bacterium]|jgi:putative ABC transport system permease protein|nr:ABC transporter permease [Vicinamibacterales bacterium]
MTGETLARDLRIGLRVLFKEKSFCALAILVLALGICGVTTMFSVVNGVMIRGFSFPNADRMVSMTFVDPTASNVFGFNGQVSPNDFEEVLREQHSFEAMAAYLNGSTVNATVNGHPQRYTGAYVTDVFLRILGVTPVLGRDFTPSDNQEGAEKVLLVGYGVWQRDFGGTTDIVGKTVRINGTTATVIGVMPQGFAFPTNEEIWLPLYSEYPIKARGDQTVVNPAVLALIKPEVPIDQANAEISTFAKRFAEAYPDTNKQFNAGQVEPLIKTFIPRALRGTLLTMLGFCVGVLLIACVNVMNMQFARATLRAKELAIRSSLGATRGRLVRQMLTESLLIATIGAAFGIGLAYLAIDILSATVQNLSTPPPSWITFDIDRLVLTFTVGSTLVAAVASGLLPAWMSSRASVVAMLKEGGRGSTSRTINLVTRSLVVFQIVVTCILLIGSLLQLESILNQQQLDYGYDTSGVMTARMGLMGGDYPSSDSRKLFYDRAVRALSAQPEFTAVGLTNRVRMVFSGNTLIELEGKQYIDKRDRPNTNFEQVTGGFFDAISQRVLEGRTFNDNDVDARLPVAIVNAAFSIKHFGNESALGRRFRTVDNNLRQLGPWRTIIGVVTTSRMQAPFNIPNVDASGFYVPFYSTVLGPPSPAPVANQFSTVVVKPRSGLPVDSLAITLRREIAKLDPNLPLYWVDTPKNNQDTFIAQNRVVATMFSIFGLVAVVLATVGIYGVMSFSVNQRTQEFGVRMALGADGGRILRMVLEQGSIQIGLGLLLGLGLALAIVAVGGSGIQSILFGVSARDRTTYGAVAAVVTIVSLIATLVPARRATRLDPVIALRAE